MSLCSAGLGSELYGRSFTSLKHLNGASWLKEAIFWLKEGQLLIFVVLYWGIWGSRNEKMHNGSCKCPLQLVNWGFNYLHWIKSVHAND